MTTDHFGFLEYDLNLSFDGGSVKTRLDIKETWQALKERINEDGYLYPPMKCRVRREASDKSYRKVPRTDRPADMHKVPASHTLTLDETDDVIAGRRGLGGFVVHLLAFLYGKKLQFHDWWLVDRIPIAESTVNVSVSEADAQKALARSVATWKGLDELNRRRMTNLLFVHAIAGALEWDWQRFLHEYMVLNACYKIAEEKANCRKKILHKDRCLEMARTYGLFKDDVIFSLFANLRNNLFHETLWDGGQIFDAASDDSFHAACHLRRFNHRLIVALLCGSGDYVRTDWTDIGTYLLSI